ncbi:hypothetical protein V8J82_03235 [Gymnodinialimonas sp. 2305UL16-5]|uniref:hypothetical protein n=1 Tax=Gymnodinialimonas mytili TaxID=3126503 RepID=UPI0030963B41
MKRAALISLAGLAAPAAQACVVEVQSCYPAADVHAEYGGHRDSVVLFSEYGPGDAHRSVVVECRTRQALSVQPDNPDDWGRFWDAEGIMSDAVYDDAAQTLRQVARQINRQTGIEAQLFTLPGSHCGCDLPAIPPPPTHCPADF